MERLHAYWRYQYIENPKNTSKNIFEELPKLNDDVSNFILKRCKYCYLILNTYPYNAGHLLAIPYRPVNSLTELNQDERIDLINLVAFAESLLTKALKPHGFNIGINLGESAGAGIPNHLHVHVVPRWNGDTNFMPVVGDTRVLPCSLQDMYKGLVKFI